MTNEPRRLSIAGHQLAYQQQFAKTRGKTGVVFLSGFGSDMSGTKASDMAERCAAADIDYLRFDYRGCGLSGGDFKQDGTIGAWLEDALAMFDQLTTGPQIVVGSSMGGWIALLLALKRPERVVGLVGIAAAPDFTDAFIWSKMDDKARAAFKQAGFIRENISINEESLIITYKLVEEGRAHLLLTNDIPLSIPVHLIQGQKDNEVPWDYAHKIADKITGPDVVLTFVKDGDHRLSRPQDLDLIGDAVVSLWKKVHNHKETKA